MQAASVDACLKWCQMALWKRQPNVSLRIAVWQPTFEGGRNVGRSQWHRSGLSYFVSLPSNRLSSELWTDRNLTFLVKSLEHFMRKTTGHVNRRTGVVTAWYELYKAVSSYLPEHVGWRLVIHFIQYTSEVSIIVMSLERRNCRRLDRSDKPLLLTATSRAFPRPSHRSPFVLQYFLSPLSSWGW